MNIVEAMTDNKLTSDMWDAMDSTWHDHSMSWNDWYDGYNDVRPELSEYLDNDYHSHFLGEWPEFNDLKPHKAQKLLYKVWADIAQNYKEYPG